MLPIHAKIKPHLVPMLLLLIATLVVHASSTGHGFISGWDDDAYVTANEAIRGFTLEHLKRAFTTFYVGNYAPLQIISYMLDYSLWGMNPAGYIATNILLHALNGLLYYFLLIKIAGRRLWAFLAAAIFLLHPVQVESVAWISQRKNVLAMFFFLISFLLYVRFRDREPGVRNAECGVRSAGGETQNSKLKTQNLFYAGSVAAFVCALLAKSVAVILPPVLLFYDICFLEKKGWRKRLPDKIPYIAAAAVVALVALKSQAADYQGGRTDYPGGTPFATFLTMLPVFVRYLGLLFWPANLSAAYNPPVRTGIDLAVALSALLVTLLCAGGFLLYRRRKELFFWGALFVAGLLPVSQIVPLVTLMNDRYLYFPMLGGAALLAGIMVSWRDSLSGAWKKAMTAVLCLLLSILSVMSFSRAKVWQDPVTLWTDAVGKVPDSVLALNALAAAYHGIGKPELALPLYERALSLAPLQREALHNISILYLENGQSGNARSNLSKLIDSYPAFAPGYVTLGNYHYDTGNLAAAESAYQKALTLQPEYGTALRNLGDLYFKMKYHAKALEMYGKALRCGGETAELHYNMAIIEAIDGRMEQSLMHLKAALSLGFNDFTAISRHPLQGTPRFQQLISEYLKR